MTSGGIVSTARTLSYYARLQEVIANNLANSSSSGFKADRLTAHSSADGTFPVPVQQLDLSQGEMHQTDRPFDLGLDGPGFFVVQTEAGERLTRSGEFQLDPAGMLTDHDGNPVLGSNGPLIIVGAKAQVHEDGSIVVDGSPLGRLRIEVPVDGSPLFREGLGRIDAPGGTRPADITGTVVRQGALESSNIDPTLGLIDLITVQRAYAANVEALRAMDGVLATTTQDIGRA